MPKRGLLSVLAAALACSGCAADAAPTTQDPVESIVVAVDGAFTSYNTQSAEGATAANRAVMNRVTPGFWRVGADGEVDPEEAIGSVAMVSADPLAVRYTFDDRAVWSDGEPLGCDDAVLAWIANSGRTDLGFRSADTSGYSLISDVACADPDRTFTVTFGTPYADWDTLFGSLLPAHIVERRADVPDLIADVRSGNGGALQLAAAVWNTGWDAPGSLDPSVLPSAGPYRVDSWAPDSVRLVANESWWGTPPKTASVDLRSVAEQDQAAALVDGSVDVIATAPSAQTLADLQLAGLDYRVGASFTSDSVVLNMRSAVYTDPLARQRFAACVPREQIVAELVQPRNPDADVLDSRFLLPFQSGYADANASPVSAPPASAAGGTIRVGGGTAGQSAVISLIANACRAAGFSVEEVGGSATGPDGALVSGVDAAVIPVVGSPRVTEGVSRYVSGGRGNAGGYQSNQADDLLYQLSTTPDRAAQPAAIHQVDAVLWADLPSIPLFAQPTLLAWRDGLSGVEHNPAAGGLTWNLEDWG